MSVLFLIIGSIFSIVGFVMVLNVILILVKDIINFFFVVLRLGWLDVICMMNIFCSKINIRYKNLVKLLMKIEL